MRIAIVGTGIAGNAAAWALSTGSPHEITVYEKDSRPGGHANTVVIDYDGEQISVDTGFIVYNELNYPNLTALFAHLGVTTHQSDMGFSVSTGGGKAEWAGRNSGMLDGFFARRRNLVSPGHFVMLKEMFRFNKEAVVDRASGRLKHLTIGEYLDSGRYSRRFREEYLVPMGAAIWSMPPSELEGFPAESFITFLENHRLLHWNRPCWRTVTGGSLSYVQKITAPFRDRIRLGTAVTAIHRHDLGVTIDDATGGRETYDQIILASHTDESRAMLVDATAAEADILGAIRYRPNRAYLHRDRALMPRRRAAWAAWNVLQATPMHPELTLTYWMNALQGMPERTPLFVTLNPESPPHPDLTFDAFSYSHPQYDDAAVAAQARLHEIQGHNRTWFCGAWTGYGFHEDGLKSGLAVAEALGATVPWRVEARRFVAAE
jgi:predicted NAD/FAD-binding protein